MPTYEYECQVCHQRVEAVQRFTDPALTVCEHCGGELRKVFSAVAETRFTYTIFDGPANSTRFIGLAGLKVKL